jgi:outer membrane protein OmpA-like peptidoglycan-associated protein
VENYLLADRVAPERLRSIGYGERDPVAPNLTPEGRTLNRRVEILIIPITADRLAEHAAAEPAVI